MPIAFKKPEKKAKRAERPHKDSPAQKENEPPQNRRIVPSPLNGVVAPVENRFQPGQSGNPGGRPKLLTESLAKELSKIVERKVGKKNVKMTRAEAIAMSICDKADSTMRESVAAFKEIRTTVEPNDADQDSAFGDKELIKMFMRTLMERQVKVKHADVLEIA